MKIKILIISCIVLAIGILFTVSYGTSQSEEWTHDWDLIEDWDIIDWENDVDWERIGPEDLGYILDKNPDLLEDAVFFEKFDQRMEYFSLFPHMYEDLGKDRLNLWLSKRSEGRLTLTEDSMIASYVDGIIGTKGSNPASLNIDKIPKDMSFEIDPSGCVRSLDKFEGCYSGDVYYDEGLAALVSENGGYIDGSKNEYFCEEKCRFYVNEDGSVNVLGQATLNQIPVEDLTITDISNGLISFIPSEVTSRFGSAILQSNEEVIYDLERGAFVGRNIKVFETGGDVIFRGTNINYRDLAILNEGSSIFTDNPKDCDALVFDSCIVIDSQGKRFNVMPIGSNIDINHLEGWALDIDKINDESKLWVMDEGRTVLKADNLGIHPRENLDLVGVDVRYIYEEGIAHHCFGNDCQQCVNGDCFIVSFRCV